MLVFRIAEGDVAIDRMPYGVSNSFKRGIMKTYGGRNGRNHARKLGDKPHVRISMDERGFMREDIIEPNGEVRPSHHKASTEPSSPAESAHKLFSDAEHHTSESPPSSPPVNRNSPPPKARKSTFNSLKRKRDASKASDEPLALGESSDNANSRRLPANKRTRLTQMQLDVGKTTRRTCRECGMEYVPSSREDERLHKDFHSMNVGGVDLGTGFAKDSQIVERYYGGEVVAMIDVRSAPTLKKRVKRVLEVVRSDLGAVEISEEQLWGLRDASKTSTAKRKSEQASGLESEGNDDRFKIFLYLAGDKCVGLCLAERIRHASKVVDSAEVNTKDEESLPDYTRSSIRTETSISPMLLGISRVWVSQSHRRKGIATTLLDAARGNFFYGIEIPRAMVAFSQPTESGRQLAEDWYEERVGWHVYVES